MEQTPAEFLSKMNLLALFLIAQAIVGCSAACNFPAIFNFGDSNSDTGGFSATFGPFPPPYGETFFGMPAGRYSDGRLLIDFIAESFGIPPLSSYLDSLGANYSGGANFAAAGSTIVEQNSSLYSPFFLAVQLKEFSQFVPRSQLVAKRGRVFNSLMPKKGYFKQALYTLDIGQNDFTAGLFAGKAAGEFFPQTIAAFSGAVKELYRLGARYFWIHNTGPLGCLTYILLRRNLTTAGERDPAGCSAFYNKLARQFNGLLNDALVELRKELPLVVITYVDVYAAKFSLFLEPAKFGFDDPLMVCCGHGGGKYNFDFNMVCGNTKKVNGSEVLLGKPCGDPSGKPIWDGAHFTEAGNKAVFNLISTGRYSDPPRPLAMACLHNEGYE